MNAGDLQRAPDGPLVVYGTTASYYTGKLEAYLRAKGIDYRLEPFSASNMRRCARHTGVVQVPQVECPDGSWLIDTTLIIEYLERVRSEPAVTPRAPAVAFVSRLVEDYADEWLWRSAMHYRWSFPETARLMSAWLAEHLADRAGPHWLKRRYWRLRQYHTFVRGDGVTGRTRAAVEASYLETLATLEPVFGRRPYVLGERPTEADFGFFASLFRHFFSDPAPARIMRERAPAVQEWVARMWNLRPDRFDAPPPDRLPDDLGALFDTITRVYLPYLEANAAAYARGEKRVRYEVQGTTFAEPVKPYRVWCRDRLQRALVALDAASQAEVQRALGASEAFERLAAPSPRPAENVIAALPLTTSPRARGGQLVAGVSPSIRILTANLYNGRADPGALAAIIEELEADIVCVQELGPRLAEALAKLLPEGKLGPDAANRGLGVACRRPVEVEQLALPVRNGWVARLSPASWPQLSEPIEIVNVHIVGPHTWPYFPRRHTRRTQLSDLLDFLDREPHIPRAILGDFNSSPIWPAYRRLAARLTDSVIACKSGRVRSDPTWPHVPAIGLTGLIRIDHCFVSKLTALDARVVPIPGSDHLGLCVDVRQE